MIRPLSRQQKKDLLNVSHEFDGNNFLLTLPPEEDLDVDGDDDNDSIHTADLQLLSPQQRIILNHRYLGAKARMAATIWNNFSGPTQRTWNERAKRLNKLPVPGKFMNETNITVQQIMYRDTLSFLISPTNN